MRPGAAFRAEEEQRQTRNQGLVFIGWLVYFAVLIRNEAGWLQNRRFLRGDLPKI